MHSQTLPQDFTIDLNGYFANARSALVQIRQLQGYSGIVVYTELGIDGWVPLLCVVESPTTGTEYLYYNPTENIVRVGKYPNPMPQLLTGPLVSTIYVEDVVFVNNFGKMDDECIKQYERGGASALRYTVSTALGMQNTMTALSLVDASYGQTHDGHTSVAILENDTCFSVVAMYDYEDGLVDASAGTVVGYTSGPVWRWMCQGMQHNPTNFGTTDEPSSIVKYTGKLNIETYTYTEAFDGVTMARLYKEYPQ